MVEFRVGGVGEKIWHVENLLKFLNDNKNQSIRLIIDPEAICLHTLGLYDILDQFDFVDIEISTCNPFEAHKKYRIIRHPFDFWFNKISSVPQELHVWNQKKTFFCLFGRPNAARLGLSAYLEKNYAKQSHIHFSASVDPDNLIQFELDKLLSYRLDSIEEVGTLLKKCPILLSDPAGYTSNQGYKFDDPLTEFYKDILVDIVVESHVAGNTFFPTEKTVRSIMLKKPFIVFSSKNYLDYLHQMGVRSFCDFWSEEYDGYEGKDRFNKILHLIDQIAGKSKTELQDIYYSMEYTLEHNYQLLVTKGWKRGLKYIE